jgi:hypothetical protein
MKQNKLERFTWESNFVFSSQCLCCQHILPYNKCEAFPDGIPPKIRATEILHIESMMGDNGIIFLLGEDMEKEYENVLKQYERRKGNG